MKPQDLLPHKNPSLDPIFSHLNPLLSFISQRSISILSLLSVSQVISTLQVLNYRRLSPGEGWEFFSSPRPDRLWGPTQPPIQWVPGALSLGVKRSGVKLTTELHLVLKPRKRGAIPAIPQYAFMAWCSVKAQEQFYLSNTWWRKIMKSSLYSFLQLLLLPAS
jgi:hypothetical protein